MGGLVMLPIISAVAERGNVANYEQNESKTLLAIKMQMQSCEHSTCSCCAVLRTLPAVDGVTYPGFACGVCYACGFDTGFAANTKSDRCRLSLNESVQCRAEG